MVEMGGKTILPPVSFFLIHLVQELAQLIPDVNTRLEEIPPYEDAHESQRMIYSTRARLDRLDPPKYSSAALANSFSSPSSTSSLPPYEPALRPRSAGYRRTARDLDVSLCKLCVSMRVMREYPLPSQHYSGV